MSNEVGRTDSYVEHQAAERGTVTGINSRMENILEHHDFVSHTGRDYNCRDMVYPLFNSVNDELHMELTTGNSKINPRIQDDELHSPHWVTDGRYHPRQGNLCSDDKCNVEIDKWSDDSGVDHTTNIKCSDSEGYYDPYTKRNAKDKASCIDGLEFWTSKMNDYRNSCSASPEAKMPECEYDTKHRNVVVVNHSTPNTAHARRSSRRSNNTPLVRAVSCKMIQVAPGEYMRLRGAHETWRAVQQDFYVPGTCICCQETLFCIQDAVFVVCPICDVVSPSQPGKILISDGYNGGVGLGFVMEELIQWQNEILASRKLKKK